MTNTLVFLCVIFQPVSINLIKKDLRLCQNRVCFVLKGLGDLGGSSWNDNNPRGGLNIDTQTQQLLNMMQTQQLLAAVQAQAKLANQANQQPPSLMGTNTGYSRQGGRMMNHRGGRFGRNDPPRQGYNRRDDRKRRRSPPARPFKRERKDDSTARFIDFIVMLRRGSRIFERGVAEESF